MQAECGSFGNGPYTWREEGWDSAGPRALAGRASSPVLLGRFCPFLPISILRLQV